ncbi:MAG TPA: hypothetical protein VGR81_02955 [Candidatus Acidoferrales bacterium]|nr:hypothetical protein [Candidatus Acidoferrales bacterium]
MKRRHIAALFLAAAVASVECIPARAQSTTAKTVKAKNVLPKVKLDTFKGDVIRMDTTSIQVRDPKDTYVVRTFTFSTYLKNKLQKLIDQGGYQSGDHVTIKYEHGTNVAEEIHGKASKAF